MTPGPRGVFVTVLVIAILVATAVFGVRPIASYRALALGASDLQIGLIAASFALLAPFAAVPLGDFLDRLGERPAVIAGSAAIACASAAALLANDLLFLAATQTLLGLGQLTVVVALHTMIANQARPEQQDGWFGYYTSAASVGHIIGPAGAGVLAGTGIALTSGAAGGMGDTVFVTATGIALLSVVLALTLPRRPGAGGRSHGERAGVRGAVRLARHPDILPALIVSGAMLAAVDVLVAYLPVYGEERGLSVELVGVLLATVSFFTLLARLSMSRTIRLLGRVRLLIASLILPALVLPALAFTADPIILFPILALAGWGLGLGQPLSLTWVSVAAPPAMRGMAMGLRMGSNRLGQIVVPGVMGVVAGAMGVAAVFWGLTALLTGSAGLVLRHPPPEQSSASGDDARRN